MNPVFAAGALLAVGAALIPVGYKYVYQPLFSSSNPEANSINDSAGRYDIVAQQDEDEEALTKVNVNRTDKAYNYVELTSEAPSSHYGHFDRSKYNQTPQSPAGETLLKVGGSAPPSAQRSPYSPVQHDEVALEDIIQQALTKQKQASPSSPAPQKAPKINEQYLTSYQQYTPSIISNTSVTVSSSSMSYQPAPLSEEDEEEYIEVVEATVVSEVIDEEPNIGKFVIAAKQEQIQRALEVSEAAPVVEEVEIIEEVNLSKFQDFETEAPVEVQSEAVAPSEESILDKFGSNETTESTESQSETPAEEINIDKFVTEEQSAPQPAPVEEAAVVEAPAEPVEHAVTEAPAEEVDISKFTQQEETQPAVVTEEQTPAEVTVEEVQAEPVDISKFSAEETAPSTSTEAQAVEEAAPQEEQDEQEEVANPVPSSKQQKKKNKKKNNKKR